MVFGRTRNTIGLFGGRTAGEGEAEGELLLDGAEVRVVSARAGGEMSLTGVDSGMLAREEVTWSGLGNRLGNGTDTWGRAES